MDEKKCQAKKVFEVLCSAIEGRSWTYEKKEDTYTVIFHVSGEDIPMPFGIQIDPESALIRLTSPLPFSMPEGKRVEGAIAVSAVNYGLADGNFDYDLANGSIVFRMTTSYRDSVIGEKLFQYMISNACQTVDAYNDKFLMLAKGLIEINAFFK